MRNLLCVALVAELGCWAPTARERPVAGSATTSDAPPIAAPARPICTEGGERLVLRTCREGDHLAWMVTNQTDVPLWVFVAPRGTKIGTYRRDNVIARIKDGELLLSKMELPPIDGERTFVAAVLLAPGETDRGTVLIGARLDPTAMNINAVAISGSRTVRSVALEVAYAVRSPRDSPQQITPHPFVVVGNFERSRQESVRAPPVPWR
jgi:hypothetical protein